MIHGTYRLLAFVAMTQWYMHLITCFLLLYVSKLTSVTIATITTTTTTTTTTTFKVHYENKYHYNYYKSTSTTTKVWLLLLLLVLSILNFFKYYKYHREYCFLRIAWIDMASAISKLITSDAILPPYFVFIPKYYSLHSNTLHYNPWAVVVRP